MYSTKSGLILGFHGCDQSVVDKITSGKDSLNRSTNDYDWLGHGIYFWENNPSRAFEYAKFLKKYPGRSKSKIEKPAVLGAVIQLGYTLDLLDHANLELVKIAHNILIESSIELDKPLASNKPIGKEKDLLLRPLDCAVIEKVHDINKGIQFDSIRAVFSEGETLYENAGFRSKDHIQICIRNPNCIKGYFIPRKEDSKYLPV